VDENNFVLSNIEYLFDIFILLNQMKTMKTTQYLIEFQVLGKKDLKGKLYSTTYETFFQSHVVMKIRKNILQSAFAKIPTKNKLHIGRLKNISQWK